MPVETNPLKIVKQVAMGPSFLTFEASASSASFVIIFYVSCVMRYGFAIVSFLAASSGSNIPNCVLSIKLKADVYDPDRESMHSES